MSAVLRGQIWRRRQPGGAGWHADVVLITERSTYGVRGMRPDGTMTPAGAYAGERWFVENFENVTDELRYVFLDQVSASLARQRRLLLKLNAQAAVAERLLAPTEVSSCAR